MAGKGALDFYEAEAGGRASSVEINLSPVGHAVYLTQIRVPRDQLRDRLLFTADRFYPGRGTRHALFFESPRFQVPVRRARDAPTTRKFIEDSAKSCSMTNLTFFPFATVVSPLCHARATRRTGETRPLKAISRAISNSIGRIGERVPGEREFTNPADTAIGVSILHSSSIAIVRGSYHSYVFGAFCSEFFGKKEKLSASPRETFNEPKFSSRDISHYVHAGYSPSFRATSSPICREG